MSKPWICAACGTAQKSSRKRFWAGIPDVCRDCRDFFGGGVPGGCTCGHREYDHQTADGDCWKCNCSRYVAKEANDE